MRFLLYLPVLLFAIVAHELGHAWVARREGDPTAERQGRITLNPIPHLELMGSLLVPVGLWFLSGGSFVFGWARPVPVDPRNFRHGKWSDIRVSLAGITMNLLLAVGFLVVAAAAMWGAGASPGAVPALELVGEMALFGIFFNLLLAVFNLIPIPPLDGSHVVFHLLPDEWKAPYRRFGRAGIGVLLLLLFVVPGAFDILLWPVDVLFGAARSILGLWT